jgi:hypothetical protein
MWYHRVVNPSLLVTFGQENVKKPLEVPTLLNFEFSVISNTKLAVIRNSEVREALPAINERYKICCGY